MNFKQKRMEQSGIKSLGELKRNGVISGKINPKKFVNGPKKIDCLVRPWQRGDCTGILAGAGVGKTTFSLHVLKHILMNNEEGVVVFVSLEMTASEIGEKWFKATEDVPELADRLYIIENYEEDGKAKDMTLADVKIELNKIKQTLNTTIHAYVYDHLHETNINGSMDYNPLCREIKNMTVELDTHAFILSQTTKEKGVGDIPVPKDGCFGTSRYENLMTNIITIFQPLRRVEKESKLSIMGWQYAKVRYKNKKDKVQEGMNYLMMFDFDTEDLVDLDNEQVGVFKLYYDKVLELRKNEAKYKSYQFCLDKTVKGKNGDVVIKDVFGGGRPEDDDL